jgi:hypothetical protein
MSVWRRRQPVRCGLTKTQESGVPGLDIGLKWVDVNECVNEEITFMNTQRSRQDRADRLRAGRFLFLGGLLLLLTANMASAQMSMTMTQTVAGLTQNGFFVPGTTELTFTCNFDWQNPDSETMSAFGLEVDLPPNWTYKDGSVVCSPMPNLITPTQNPNAVNFVWFLPIPAFPFTVAYSVNIPAGEQGPVTLTGQANYRTTGDAQLSNAVDAIIQQGTASVMPVQTLTGFTGGFYAPGATIGANIAFTESGPAALTAFSWTETLPDGWAFVGGSVTGAQPPDVLPADGATGLLTFTWQSSVPTFPMDFNFEVSIPTGAQGNACLTGVAVFDSTEQTDLHSLPVGRTDCATDQPCIGMARTPKTQCYAAGRDFPVDVTLTKACSEAVTALRTEETLPAGWTFVSVSGDPAPDTAPSPGATGALQFGWTSAIPAFPFTFSYVVHVPEDQVGGVTLTGQTLYHLGGPEIATGSVDTSVCEHDVIAPVITLLGSNPVTVECGATYTDAGATAHDNDDGDISAKMAVVNPVDTKTPGVYTITYNVTDTAGNPAAEVTRTVNVTDTTPPVITLNGLAEQTVECSSIYADAGATAADGCAGDLTRQIAVTSQVDTTRVGYYTVTYNVQDPSGNAASQVVRILHVTDTIAPVLTLIGAADLTLECGGTYADAGATATDACDNAVTTKIQVTNPVDTHVPGAYTVAYNVTDASGNAAAPITRTVHVTDTTKPVLALLGSATVTVECKAAYTDAGATATDVCSGDLTGGIVLTGSVNTDTPGNYTLTYNVTDAAGNAADPVVRSVQVTDTRAPIITLTGATDVMLEAGQPYTDAGATVADTCDPNVVVTTVNPVDNHKPGVYTIRYNAQDISGNKAVEVVRTVTVKDLTPPVITLKGSDTLTVECGSVFNDPGTVATDNVDGDITANVQVAGSVNAHTGGQYTLTYSVSDAAGNAAAPVTRTVTVQDTTAPGITLLGNATATVECGGTYADAGATASDVCSGDLTSQIVKGGSVNTAVTGTYHLTFDVIDGAGNAAARVTRTVFVLDSIRPSIALLGGAVVNLECGAVFTDPGATATDSCDGNLTASIQVAGDTVNTHQTGSYNLSYSVHDSAGNSANPVTRTVNVSDTTPPVLTLNGDAQLLVACGSTFADPGATAIDACDGAVQVAISGAVNTAVAGVYTLTYQASDHAGQNAQTTRTVTVACAEGESEGAQEGEGQIEGQVEGQIEGQPETCELAAIAITEPHADKVVPEDGVFPVDIRSSATFAQPDLCSSAVVEVTYLIDGQEVARSRDRASGFPIRVELDANNHALEAVAAIVGSDVSISDQQTIVVRTGQDVDHNGIDDNPFADLPADGDTWYAVANNDVWTRSVMMVAAEGSCTADVPASVQFTLTHAALPSLELNIVMPYGLLACGEKAVIMAAYAPTLAGLLGADELAVLGSGPDNAVAGAGAFDISVLVSTDDGQTFAPIDNARLAANPITIALTGIPVQNGQVLAFFEHHSLLSNESTTGVQLLAAQGQWTSQYVQNLNQVGDALSGAVTSLSIFVPAVTSVPGPTISVSPDPNYEFQVGIVQAGKYIDSALTVTNVGGGVVTGSATLEDTNGVFSLIGSTDYALHNADSAQIALRFLAKKPGQYTARVTFSGGDNGPLVLNVRAEASSKKCLTIFGCGAGGGAGSGLGDAAVAAIAFLLLAVSGRRARRAR